MSCWTVGRTLQVPAAVKWSRPLRSKHKAQCCTQRQRQNWKHQYETKQDAVNKKKGFAHKTNIGQETNVWEGVFAMAQL